ncbi:hypothetical protein FA15DRAFT_740824 [Coprinopsis marcescibilis]|uniref:Uncharacterized protein n=1 Tax=Coprinopsis marcescibilis TaxID=230819 RepID=A0A5C3KWN8_COPMA|nr:hypothetical protein FA15DRAFT_740824 [Coprinopsis marcescibilis]
MKFTNRSFSFLGLKLALLSALPLCARLAAAEREVTLYELGKPVSTVSGEPTVYFQPNRAYLSLVAVSAVATDAAGVTEYVAVDAIRHTAVDTTETVFTTYTFRADASRVFYNPVRGEVTAISREAGNTQTELGPFLIVSYEQLNECTHNAGADVPEGEWRMQCSTRHAYVQTGTEGGATPTTYVAEAVFAGRPTPFVTIVLGTGEGSAPQVSGGGNSQRSGAEGNKFFVGGGSGLWALALGLLAGRGVHCGGPLAFAESPDRAIRVRVWLYYNLYLSLFGVIVLFLNLYRMFIYTPHLTSVTANLEVEVDVDAGAAYATGTSVLELSLPPVLGRLVYCNCPALDLLLDLGQAHLKREDATLQGYTSAQVAYEMEGTMSALYTWINCIERIDDPRGLNVPITLRSGRVALLLLVYQTPLSRVGVPLNIVECKPLIQMWSDLVTFVNSNHRQPPVIPRKQSRDT